MIFYPDSRIHCNLCGSSNYKVLFRYDEYPDGYFTDTLQCNDCGLIFRAGSKDDCQIEKAARKAGFDRLSYSDEYTMLRTKIFKNYLRVVSHFRKTNRLLDVGSGQGLFLALARQNGWEG